MGAGVLAGAELRCPLCGSTRIEELFRNALKCSECKLIFINISELDLEKIYDSNYFKGKVYRDYMREAPIRLKIFREKLRLIREYLPDSGKLLDVGAAAGFFLEAVKELKYETYGVEISEYASSFARSQFKHNIVTGDFLKIDLPEDYFNVVTMWDILEHFVNPFEALKKSYKILKNNGVLVVETLNTDTLLFKILRDRWPLFAPPYHLYYFNKRNLTLALENSGFNVIKAIPIQTYIPYMRESMKFIPFRYFKFPLIRTILGLLLDDVILVISKKV